jgi:hypothetical protein
MSEHTIFLIGGEKDETCTVTAEPINGLCQIKLHYRGKTIESSATDYFDAFSRIRLLLESENLIPFCYGASLNVFPSAMARQMGAGLSGYRCALGRAATREDIVPIFDSGPDVIPASVANQTKYHNDWAESL